MRNKELYKSPIEKIYGDIQTQMVQEDENMVMKAIRNVGVNVDKEALIKALQYDRNQYTKGYKDGKNAGLDKVRAEVKALLPTEEQREEYGVVYEVLLDVLKIIDKCKAESVEE